MTNHTFGKIYDLLNNVVNGEIENFIVNIDEGKLKGENFLGEITFVSLKKKNTSELIDLVVKQAFEIMTENTFFNTVYITEIKFYEEVWPVLDKFQNEHALGFNKIPKCLATCSTPGKEKIVLEDLRSQGFKLYEKTNPVDRKHYEVIFKSYGIYHAISYAFKELHPEDFSKLVDLIKKDKPAPDPEKAKHFATFLARSAEVVRDLFDPQIDEDIYKTLENVCKNPMKQFEPSFAYKGETQIVLHGDCWSNNMMFKYDENGNVEDMRFLDFQMVGTGTPVNDLAYSFYSGASNDLMNNLNDFLEIYIESFSETLEKFNCKPTKPYTLETLKSEWKQYSKFGFMMGIMLWRIKLVDKNHIPNLADPSSMGGNLSPIAEEHAEEFNQRVKDLATHFYRNDYF